MKAVRVWGRSDRELDEQALCLRQSSVVPFRRREDGVDLCLVTSRAKGKWIFPKGAVEPDETHGQAALKEAYEEAGLRGRILGSPLGVYADSKSGSAMEVTVFLMEVQHSLRRWPEHQQRKRCFVSFSKATGMLKKPALREILKIVEQRFSY